jgi:hypothetical protein
MAAFVETYACSTHIRNDRGGGVLSGFAKGFGLMDFLAFGLAGAGLAASCGGAGHEVLDSLTCGGAAGGVGCACGVLTWCSGAEREQGDVRMEH